MAAGSLLTTLPATWQQSFPGGRSGSPSLCLPHSPLLLFLLSRLPCFPTWFIQSFKTLSSLALTLCAPYTQWVPPFLCDLWRCCTGSPYASELSFACLCLSPCQMVKVFHRLHCVFFIQKILTGTNREPGSGILQGTRATPSSPS